MVAGVKVEDYSVALGSFEAVRRVAEAVIADEDVVACS